VSRSGELIVLAVARARKVGVDVEKTRLDIEADAIAERFFSRREVGIVASSAACPATSALAPSSAAGRVRRLM
jgi:phosphopantetheinyl transferase